MKIMERKNVLGSCAAKIIDLRGRDYWISIGSKMDLCKQKTHFVLFVNELKKEE